MDVQEGLSWFDREGVCYPSAEELAAQAEQEKVRLAGKLRELGVDPEAI